MKHARFPRNALLVWALALCSVGCEEVTKIDGSLGDRGRVELTYRRSCFFGCPLEQPLLVGARETILVHELKHAVRPLRAQSTDEQIARFASEHSCYCEREDSSSHLEIAETARCEAPWTKACEVKVQVEAVGEGVAKVQLFDGELFVDEAEVLVRRARAARFFGTLPTAIGATTDDAYELATGAQLELRVELYDDRERKLLAPEGVTWRSSDARVANVSGFLIAPSAEIHGGLEVLVNALSVGTTQVEVEVPGLTKSVDVRVTTSTDAAIDDDDGG